MRRAGADFVSAANPGAAIAPHDGSLIYVYGVTRCGAMAPGAAALVEGLIPGACVKLVPAGRLAAAISRVPSDVFISGGADMDGAGHVLAHHRVLASLSQFCTVAPMKFGVTCRDPDAVMDALVRSTAMFEHALTRAEGAAEWRVKLHADVEVCRAAVRAALAQKAAGRSAPAPARGSASASAISVFFRRKVYRDLDNEVLRDLTARAESVHRLITAKTREAAPDAARGLCAGWNGYAPALILKSAYLVERASEDAFKQDMADLGEVLEAEGCQLELSGPWPPYSFAAVDIPAPDPQDF